MASSSTPELRRAVRIFAIGIACGFIAGVFLTAGIVWQFGNVFGTRTAHAEKAPSAVERWGGSTPPDADSPVIEAAKGTTGTSGAHDGPSAPATISGPLADELDDRDLLVPVEGIGRDQLVRSFDDDRGNRRHEAIDILAPTGTPVLAIEDGRIARLFNSKAGGITIYQFDPTEHYCYYYAHLDKYAEGLKEQDFVRKGQVIGYVGISGNAPKNTPHLHFAVYKLTDQKRWWEGSPIDPYDVLR